MRWQLQPWSQYLWTWLHVDATDPFGLLLLATVLSPGALKSFRFLISIFFKAVAWFALWFLSSAYHIKGEVFAKAFLQPQKGEFCLKKVKLHWLAPTGKMKGMTGFPVTLLLLFVSLKYFNQHERAVALWEWCNLRKPFRNRQIDLQLIKLYLSVVSKSRFMGGD